MEVLSAVYLFVKKYAPGTFLANHSGCTGIKNKIGVPKNSEVGCCYMPSDTAADSNRAEPGLWWWNYR